MANLTSTLAFTQPLRDALGWVKKPRTDSNARLLFGIVLALVIFGVVMVASATTVTSYLASRGPWGAGLRQAGYAVVGVLIMWLASRMKLETLKRSAAIAFVIGLAAQALVFTPLGYEVWGNRNWVRIAGITLQPSEFLKLFVVLMLSLLIIRREKMNLPLVHQVIPVALIGGFAIGLVLAGHDLGTASIMFLAVLGAMYFGGMSAKSIMVMIGGAVAGAVVLVLTSPSRISRILSLGAKEGDYLALDWQPLHGLWALAGGGIGGSGLGSSKAKWSWLPAADNDYIFSIIGEELGLFGTVAVVLAFVALAWVMLRIIRECRDTFGRAVVGGVLAWIIGQAMVNIGVVLRIFPVLGVPLPLISAGGTALLACLLAMGVVLAIARDNAKMQEELQATAPASR